MDITSELQKMREKAESYYLAGDFRCSETVLKVIFEHFTTELPEDIVSLASAFPHGVGGSGCICGALAGGTMALGMFFGRSAAKEDDKVKKAMELSNELHNIFKKNHKVTCCRILIKKLHYGSPEHRQQCARFTGRSDRRNSENNYQGKGRKYLKAIIKIYLRRYWGVTPMKKVMLCIMSFVLMMFLGSYSYAQDAVPGKPNEQATQEKKKKNQLQKQYHRILQRISTQPSIPNTFGGDSS